MAILDLEDVRFHRKLKAKLSDSSFGALLVTTSSGTRNGCMKISGKKAKTDEGLTPRAHYFGTATIASRDEVLCSGALIAISDMKSSLKHGVALRCGILTRVFWR